MVLYCCNSKSMKRKKLKTKLMFNQTHTQHTCYLSLTPLPLHQRYCHLFRAQHGNGHVYLPHEKKTLPKTVTFLKLEEIPPNNPYPSMIKTFLTCLNSSLTSIFFPFGSIILGFILFIGPKTLKHKRF